MQKRIRYGLWAIAVGVVCAQLVAMNQRFSPTDSTYNIQFPASPFRTLRLSRSQRDPLPAVEIGKNHEQVKEAFRNVVERANQITLRIMISGNQVAQGTLLSSYIVTKASQLEGHQQVLCRDPQGNRFVAQVAHVDESRDVAVLTYDAKKEVVTLPESSEPPLGSWLVTAAGYGPEPLAISVVSTVSRPIAKEVPILGVELNDRSSTPRVTRVLEATAAESAGLKPGDWVTHLNGTRVTNRHELVRRIRSYRPGDSIQMKVSRNGKQFDFTVPLGRISQLGLDPSDTKEFGGPLSNRRSDFPMVIQHDAILRPHQCGGPVVDLNGRLVGINIARASRVASYVLPISEVHKALSAVEK